MVHGKYSTASTHMVLRVRTKAKLTPEKTFNAPSRGLHVPLPPSKLSLCQGYLRRVISVRGVQKIGPLVPTRSVPRFFPGSHSSLCPLSLEVSERGRCPL